MQAVPALPLCPFARRGIDDPTARSCPGYAAAVVSFRALGAGDSIGLRETCGHLGSQRGARGWVSACTHPAGLPQRAPEIARRTPRHHLAAAG